MENRLVVRQLSPGKIEQIVEVFQECLVDRGLGSGVPRYTPLIATAQLVASLGAKCAIAQRDVQDPDFLAEHSAYYSRWTSSVSRYCFRIHFFSVSPSSGNILEAIDELADGPNCYLGFVTLRPISMSPVAATILSPPTGDKRFLLSKDEFRVNISGRPFFVTGTPFMQQDNAVGACAQASIWMALRTLRRKEGQAAFSPAQITTAATKFLVMRRTLPNRGGLSIEQISEALRGLGYAPHMIPLRRSTDQDLSAEDIGRCKKTLYPYVESGIPVLLVLFPAAAEGHAVILIGHHWEEVPSNLITLASIESTGRKVEILDAASWVEPFIIHNDNSGPYLRLPEKSAQGYCLQQAFYAIPLLQPDIFTDADEAQALSIRLLEHAIHVGANVQTEAPEEFPKIQLVMRTFLQERSDFRARVVDSDLPKEVKDYYRLKWLPKRLWVTELNAFDGYSEAPDRRKLLLGEILIDPAGEAEGGAFLSIRLGEDLVPPGNTGVGIVIDRDALNNKIKAFPTPGERATPLVRDSV